MKKKITIFILVSILQLTQALAGNYSLSLQPDSCQGKDSKIGDCIPCGYYNLNFGSDDDLTVGAWTVGGNQSVSRSMIKFDLSSIPTSATITSAKLSLYHNPNPANGNIGHSQISGSNAGWIQRIETPWTEFGVTWGNQPTTTTQDEVVIPASTSNTQDYINIDVTTLVQDMVANPLQSYGFMLRLQTEAYYRSLLFASSDHPDPNLHPKLQIEYSDTNQCLSLQPDNSICSEGKDTKIGDCLPSGYNTLNFGLDDDLTIGAWTVNGNASISRSLLEFDISSIPPSSTVTSASLSLYHNPNPANGNIGHSQLSGSNEAWIERITTPWTELGVTWNTQPNVTTQNLVVLPASTSANQDYTNIDVTTLVQDMVNNPSQSFGFMIRLVTESYYRSLLFASSDYSNPSLHPKLEVCFKSESSAVNEISNGNIFTVSPNPITQSSILKINANIKVGRIEIYDMVGKEIVSEKMENTIFEIGKLNLPDGMYLVSLVGNNKRYSQKIIIQ